MTLKKMSTKRNEDEVKGSRTKKHYLHKIKTEEAEEEIKDFNDKTEIQDFLRGEHFSE